jgi:hypothetical protein
MLEALLAAGGPWPARALPQTVPQAMADAAASDSIPAKTGGGFAKGM